VAGERVLIVEDDEITALVLSEYLTAHGYRTTVAATGYDGVTRFIAEAPDLALVDVLLPKKDGFDVCYAMKSSDHGRTTPVVLMSAVYRDPQATEYARGVLADGFLQKPFDLDDLVARVDKLVKRA
jgi:DNA-binding response OmpR family regulator